MERHRRSAGGLDLDALVLVVATWLAAVGVAATLLALIGVFGPISMSVVTALGAAIAWPWRRAVTPAADVRSRSKTRADVVFGVVLVLGGLALRWPLADYPLAGRDQGTYTLRAQHTLREGTLDSLDPVLARIEQTRTRPGPADLQGLYQRRTEPWRRNRYEAAYRPGFYLADLDTGHVRPQFFHMHPMLMATAGLVVGPSNVVAVTLVWSTLALLALWAVARRLWKRGPWAWLAAALWASAPLVIWVQRNALSEGPATVFVLASLLAALRVRDGDEPSLDRAALLLGANAWVRGNGWLAVPLVLAAQWLVPRTESRSRRAGLLYALAFVTSVFVHAPTIFPYLNDELLRQLPLDVHPTPSLLITACVAGVAAWFAIDELSPLRRHEARWHGAAHRLGPWVLAGLAIASVAMYLNLRVEPLARPFSRLDPVAPLLGWPMLLLAVLGLGHVVRSWRSEPTGANAWLLGLGGVLVATLWLYAQRNLPQLGLYYYGRYLVPELVPAVVLLAVQGLRSIDRRVRGESPGRARLGLAVATAVSGTAAMGWFSAGVLATHPVTRLQEFAGADRVVDHLAAKLPADAVVIAGGEGWHRGHTFNQVGGALAFRHGIAVLPYRNREAAYASLHELLIGRPEATGEPAPPVFLLLNEATKDHTRDPKDPDAKIRIAALDDQLPPPFVAHRIDFVEMLLHRLTPTHEAAPTRVTRDGLRMALMRIEVDPARARTVEEWTLHTEGKTWRPAGPDELLVEGGKPKDGAPCLGGKPLEITLPESGAAGTGPVSLVIVAAPGTARRNAKLKIAVDGKRIALSPEHDKKRYRDTLGPYPLTSRPKTILIKGPKKKKTRRARCPKGGIAQIRLLGPDQAMLDEAERSAVTFAPPLSLGHPVKPVAWVSGAGLSRERPGIAPKPEIRGLSMVLGNERLRFPPTSIPSGGKDPVDLVLTLTGTQLSPQARLWVYVDGKALEPIDPPDDRKGSWQSPALPWTPTGDYVQIELELRDADPEDHVLLRDIGLFSRAKPEQGTIAER